MSTQKFDSYSTNLDSETYRELLILGSEDRTRKCIEIQSLADEYLAEPSLYASNEEFLIELLMLNKALAGLVIDTNFALESVAKLIPTIRSSEETRVCLTLRREKKTALAKAGKSGARSKHSKVYALKAWAEQEAKAMTDSDTGIARQLAARIPKHLAGASKNPERLIYDHLRALRNTAG